MELLQLFGSGDPTEDDGPSSPHFDETPVPVAVLAAILNAGHHALSGLDLDPARFVLLQSAERKALLHRAIRGPAKDKIIEAPVVIVALSPRDDSLLIKEVMGAFTSLMKSASGMGWDTWPIVGFNRDAVSRALSLSTGAVPVALLAAGRFRQESSAPRAAAGSSIHRFDAGARNLVVEAVS
jgi:nitroreductase